MITKFKILQNSTINPFFIQRVGKILLILVLIEILLGGNGHLIQIEGIRLRVILYIISLCYFVFYLINKDRPDLPSAVIKLFIAFCIITIFCTIRGLLNNNSLFVIFDELRGLIYFPMIFFFASTIKDKKDLELISKLIVSCAIFQAVIYLYTLGGIYSGFFSAQKIFLFLKNNSEFIFRHNPEQKYFVGFFYKGAFHLGTAILFILFFYRKIKVTLAFLIIFALALSLTRGLMVSVIISSFLGIYFIKDIKKTFSICCVLISGIIIQYYGLQVEADLTQQISPIYTASLKYFYSPKTENQSSSFGAEIINCSSQKPFFIAVNDSGTIFNLPKENYGFFRQTDNLRLTDIQTVIREIDLKTFFFGRGLGSPVGTRMRVELVFLEIFYKQGIFGLIFWLSPLGLALMLFQRMKITDRSQALPFFLSIMFVYLSSITNNFLTGSIGMSIIHVCIIALITIKNKT